MSEARPTSEQRSVIEIGDQERRLWDLYLWMPDRSTESTGLPEGNAGAARGRSCRKCHGCEKVNGRCVEEESDG